MNLKIKKMKTRSDYIAKRCTHSEYYSQFVTEEIKSKVRKFIGISKLFDSTDDNLNDIPLREWDCVPISLNYDLLKQSGANISLSTKVCILKEAARIIIEEEKQLLI